MNYGNRNASSPNTTGDILFGYTAAVVSSVGLGVGLKKLAHNSTKNLVGGSAILANAVLSYFAVATAGFFNSFCMRMGEMNRGIKIYKEDGTEAGTSIIAAKKAVYQTSFSRLLLSAPTFFIPGITFFLLGKFNLIPKSKGPKTIQELLVVSMGLYFALPISVSIFPQYGVISSSLLEEQFKSYETDKNGKLIEVNYYYNKGLWLIQSKITLKWIYLIIEYSL